MELLLRFETSTAALSFTSSILFSSSYVRVSKKKPILNSGGQIILRKNIPVPFVRILKQKTTTQLPSQLHRPNQELLFGNPFSFGGFLGLEHGEAGKVGKGWPSVESMDESQVVWCLQVTNVNLSRGQVHAGHSAGRSVKMVFFWKFILYLLAKRVLWYILLKVRNLRHCLGLV